MARLIEDKIKRPLSEALLFGELNGGGSANIDRNADSTGLTVQVTEPGTEPIESVTPVES
jgi:hypothetical protein